MHTRDVVILANSRKYGGHCIAGKDIRTGKWIRLINKLDDHGKTIPFSGYDLFTLFGSAHGPTLFECLRIQFINKCPFYCQPENELISREKWQSLGFFPIQDLPKLEDPEYPIWLGQPDFGNSDNIPYSICNAQNPLICSLVFRKLTQEMNQIEIGHKHSLKGRIQYLLNFNLNSVAYSLVITDIHSEAALLKEEIKEGRFPVIYATIGVGQIYPEMASHYKLIVGLALGE